MELRSGTLFRKEIFCVTDGRCLGTADELLVEYDSAAASEGPAKEGGEVFPGARVRALLVRGRPRFFGLFGREHDLRVEWEDILVIGEDAILIKGGGKEIAHEHGSFWTGLFSGEREKTAPERETAGFRPE